LTSELRSVVVVGASLAGVRAAETLRSEGFDGEITVVGDEPHRPYDRPPLSKDLLTAPEPADITLRSSTDLDVTWELGAAAERLDLGTRVVHLAGGRQLPFDGLVLACGARARTLPGTEHLAAVTALRTLDDARALREALDAGARRVLVVGAGFIGAEVAASCRTRGSDVVVVEPLAQPLARALGEGVGALIADLHRSHGVDLRLGVGVTSVAGEGDGPVRVELTDGAVEEFDRVVVGIGVIPNTDWLAGSGLTIDDGVVCDETTLAAPGVVAAGDVARWPNPLFGETMRVEHWEHALDMAAHAARRLLAADGEAVTYAPVPWFWSDQYDRKIQLAGRVRPTDDVVVVGGSVADMRFCALYGREGRVTGVLAVNMPAKVVRYRRAIAEGLGWDEALAEVEVAEPLPAVPA
jgi:NADPH-dependent 2,4-dienoyl-CoA reductase/sulfur reductase-like enzyme